MRRELKKRREKHNPLNKDKKNENGLAGKKLSATPRGE